MTAKNNSEREKIKFIQITQTRCTDCPTATINTGTLALQTAAADTAVKTSSVRPL